MRVVIHGNCQAWAIAELMKEVFPHWTINAWQVHQITLGDQLEAYRSDLRSADICLYQPVSDNYRDIYELSSSFVTSEVNRSALLISYPSMYFQGHHPTQYWLNDDGVVMSMFFGSHDILLLKFMYDGLDCDEAIARLMSPHVLTARQIKRAAERSLSELKRREDAENLAIRVSDFIETLYEDLQLFHTVNHPSRPVISTVVNRFAALAGYNITTSPIGREVLASEHIPCLPCVDAPLRRKTNLAAMWDHCEDQVFRIDGHKWTREEYYKRCYRFMSEPRDPRRERGFTKIIGQLQLLLAE